MSDKCQRSTYIFNFTIHFLYIPVPTFCKKQIHWSLVNIFNCLAYDWMVKYGWKFTWHDGHRHDSIWNECCYIWQKKVQQIKPVILTTLNFNSIIGDSTFYFYVQFTNFSSVYFAAVKYFKTKEGLYFKWFRIFTI
jgi:hypothetical protein